MRATPAVAGGWSTPDDIRRTLERQWQRGTWLTETPEPGPYRIGLAIPTVHDISRRHREVQAWVAALETERTMGYEIIAETRNFRTIGTNRIPVAVSFATLDALLDAIGRRAARASWLSQITAAAAVDPRLAEWVCQNPHRALDAATIWPHVLAVLTWFRDHPASGLYLRQVDVPGVHTKFIETHAALFQTLVDELHPSADGCGSSFVARVGLREKEPLIQVRSLDPARTVGGMRQFATPMSELRRLELRPRRVIITENEINGLALPTLPGAIAIFGRGYAVDMLAQVPWIANATVHYWGDLDTHGFAILDRVRAYIPQAQSFLMDADTLLTHRDHWGRETSPTRIPLTRLTREEASVYASLVDNVYVTNLRLEQEHIRYRHVLMWARSLDG